MSFFDVSRWVALKTDSASDLLILVKESGQADREGGVKHEREVKHERGVKREPGEDLPNSRKKAKTSTNGRVEAEPRNIIVLEDD
jgi:hypothetical protein